MITGRQAVQHFDQRQQAAGQLVQDYQSLLRELEDEVRKVDAERLAALQALAAAYLRELSRDAFQLVEQLTGFVGFERRDPFAAMDHERKTLEKTMARIDADERYGQREVLVGPHGTLSQKLDEAREQRAPWQEECATFEGHEGFRELVAAGYDTPAFTTSWWQAGYWKMWAAGDRITKALGMDDFGDDVLPAYRRCSEQRSFWDGEVAQLETQISAVHELVQSRDYASARLPQLPAIYLQQCQEYLASYLGEADLALLEEWATEKGDGERAILAGLRRVAGLSAKIRFLQEIHDEGLRDTVNAIAGRQAKFKRKAIKFSRPKNTHQRFSPSVLDQSFDSAASKHRARIDKLRKTVSRVSSYDRYEDFPLSNPWELWWLEFAGSAPPPYAPRLRNWYERNQGLAPVRDASWVDGRDGASDATTAVALAAAARELDDVGYLS